MSAASISENAKKGVEPISWINSVRPLLQAERQVALDAGKALLGKWADSVTIDVNQKVTVETLDQSLDIVSGVNGRDLRRLLLAICETVTHDGRLGVAERELIRVICASLDCPLPPILTVRAASPS